MTNSFVRRLGRTASVAALLASLAACSGATPPSEPGLGDAMPAMQPGPVTVGPGGLGPAGRASAIGSGNLANPGVANPGPSATGY